MKTVAFAALAVGVILCGGEAVGQSGPPNYQNKLSWQKYSPWGVGGQLEMKVDLSVVPSFYPTYLDFSAATVQGGGSKKDPDFYWREKGQTTYPQVTTSHTFDNYPGGCTCWVNAHIEPIPPGTGSNTDLEISASL